MSKDVVLGNEAKSKLLNGINKLANAAKVTLGPEGKTITIRNQHGKYYPTKDGVSIINSIVLEEEIDDIGAQMVKEVAQKTLKLAGDGTTTSIVITQALVNIGMKYINEGGSYTTLKEVYKTLTPEVVKLLKANSKKLNKALIKDVAKVSGNNDDSISEIVSKAFSFSKIVKVEEGSDLEDTITKIEGVQYPVTYFSKEFVNNTSKMTCTLDDPLVLLLDCKLTGLENLEKVMVYCNENKKSLVIFTEHITENELSLLEDNQNAGALKLLPIKTPGHGKYRKEYIKDISLLTNAKIIKNLKTAVSVDSLGELKKAESDILKTVLLPMDNISITGHIKDLSAMYNDGDLDEYSKEMLGERIKNLNAKVSIIKVGGKSDIEIKERYDRVDDAVRAVSSALEEGVILGGGVTLYNIANELDLDSQKPLYLILEALRAPNKTINENGANVNPTTFNDFTVLDPTKVTRCAFENAVSVALTILSIEGIVLTESIWN